MAECRRYVGGTRTNGGYVRVPFGEPRQDGKGPKLVMLHRHIVERVEGRKLKPWPEEVVMHSCDVRDCFLYEHLSVGTYADNNRDCREKGRAVNLRGEAHGLTSITDEDVRTIRRLREEGQTLKAIAAQFPVCATSVRNILAGRTWGHVK